MHFGDEISEHSVKMLKVILLYPRNEINYFPNNRRDWPNTNRKGAVNKRFV